MAQTIKIKRGGISGLSGLSTTQGELILATGSLGNNVDGQFLLAHGDSLGLVAGAIFTGSSVPTISDSQLNGILFYDDSNNKFYRLDSNGNQVLDVEATAFSGTTDNITEGSTNLYYTDARVKTKLNTENVVSGSATDVRTFLNVEDGADVTDFTNVQSAGAVMDSEVTDLDGIKSLTVPNNTTISSFGATLVDDANAAAAIATLGLDADLATFSVPASTTISTFGASLVDDTDAATARGTLGVDAAGTDNSTDVTLAGSYNYLSLSGQQITLLQVDASTDISNLNTDNVSEGATNLYASTANVKTALNANLGTLTIGDSNDTVSVPGNLSVGGTLTTVSSNEVNIGDRIVVLNASDAAGDAGIQVHDTVTNQTGSLLWDTSGDYWKAGEIGSENRVVTFDSTTPQTNGFIHLDGNREVVSVAQGVAGSFLQSDGDGTFSVSNTIDGGTF